MARQFKTDQTSQRLIRFITDFAADSGFSQVVIGLSGGVDSSLSAALGVRALGPENVLGLIMPYRASSPQSEQDAEELAGKLGIAIEKFDLTPMIDAWFGDQKVSAIRRGNKLARERMSILFDIASRDNRLVLGTSNKTEIALGYSTWYGDSACSFNPLGGLYKNEVRRLAAHLGVPKKIIEKNPTADLWPGQTDEDELGVSYDLADRILYKIIEENERSIKRLTATVAEEKTVELIVGRINKYAFKRSLPATDLIDGQPVPDKVTLTES